MLIGRAGASPLSRTTGARAIRVTLHRNFPSFLVFHALRTRTICSLYWNVERLAGSFSVSLILFGRVYTYTCNCFASQEQAHFRPRNAWKDVIPCNDDVPVIIALGRVPRAKGGAPVYASLGQQRARDRRATEAVEEREE